jgi:hypothetical protein
MIISSQLGRVFPILPLVAALLGAGCVTQPDAASSRTSSHSLPEAPVAAVLAPMPEPVTSFAAVTHQGAVYVLGGHNGERHDYNSKQVSGSFHRLLLSDGSRWETLPAGNPAQGLPLVAHQHHLYRTGGMAARNQPGEKQDLISSTEVSRFNTRTLLWEPWTPLPEPRSSHDAVVVGDHLYVGGGWSMSGGTNTPTWPNHFLSLDLRNPKASWVRIPQPFQRRAIALAAQGRRLHFIGGMDNQNRTTLAVDVYDLDSQQWSKGPNLPEGRFKGFACSAIQQAGRIHANTFQGDLLRLSADGSQWDVIGRVQHPRMAHRIVTAGSSQVIVLGGEDGESKRPDLELLPAQPVISRIQTP